MKKGVAWGVLIFIVLFSISLCAEKARADVSLGLTGGMLNSDGLRSHRLGWTNHRWFTRVERLGGENYNDTWAFSAGRRVYATQWQLRPYMELGLGYFDDILEQKGDPLVSEHLTFELVVGASYTLSPISQIELAWIHNSTAGRSDKNTGIDRVFLGYTWKF